MPAEHVERAGRDVRLVAARYPSVVKRAASATTNGTSRSARSRPASHRSRPARSRQPPRRAHLDGTRIRDLVERRFVYLAGDCFDASIPPAHGATVLAPRRIPEWRARSGGRQSHTSPRSTARAGPGRGSAALSRWPLVGWLSRSGFLLHPVRVSHNRAAARGIEPNRRHPARRLLGAASPPTSPGTHRAHRGRRAVQLGLRPARDELAQIRATRLRRWPISPTGARSFRTRTTSRSSPLRPRSTTRGVSRSRSSSM